MTIEIKRERVNEMRNLAVSGDLKVPEYRELFKHSLGEVAPDLTDEQVLVAMALTDDDDDEQFVEKASNILSQGYRIID